MPNTPEKGIPVPNAVEEVLSYLSPGGPEKANTVAGEETGKGGEQNTFVGKSAGRFTTTGARNVAVGLKAGEELTTGKSNTFVGSGAGQKNNEGEKNVYVGAEAGEGNVGGAGNVFIGFEVGGTQTGTSNKLLVGNNLTTPIIQGVMSATAASNELGLGTDGGKIGFLAVAEAPVVAKAAGAETTAAIWARLKELGLTT